MYVTGKTDFENFGLIFCNDFCIFKNFLISFTVVPFGGVC